MAVTSSWRTLIPHTESKRKAPQRLVLESLTNGGWLIDSSLPEIFLLLSRRHCQRHSRACKIAVRSHTSACYFHTGCVLKRPEDESPVFDAWKKAVRRSFFSHDAYSNNMPGINWRMEKKPSFSALEFPLIQWHCCSVQEKHYLGLHQWKPWPEIRTSCYSTGT